MIKLEELRVSNWVYFRDPARNINTPIQINCIDQYEHLVGYKSESGDIFCEQKYVEPISLTELMLLKCGFEETQLFEDDLVFLFLNGFGLRIDYFEDAFYFDDTKIEYVHQLVNLYFAITGKELDVKL